MKNDNYLFWLIGIGSLIFMGFTLYENYMYAVHLGSDKQGIFGDMFGASNALFTGLSFTGVIIAILLQRQELKLQRKELELTREEMKLTRLEFNQQNETLTKQQFENTFFQMISMYRDNTEKMTVDIQGVKSEGKPLFQAFNKKLNDDINTFMKNRFKKNNDNVEDKFFDNLEAEKLKLTINELVTIYERRYKSLEDEFVKYFSTIIIILKLVDQAKIDDKFFYISILKSHFTKYETLVVFYQTISQDPNNEFRKLVDRYSIVNDLEVKLIVNPNHFLNYKQKQFLNDYVTQSDKFFSTSTS
ncbi:Putative phage abortive infection protein [Chryseobacterium arachidis]|uniref:Putative phage abortive infection protein n=1 Tax=Chryseobacterium arachidis TaxID=1416778 RepID=A0A1M5C760_9FLAO|nr:putative phage abortive infection protein [Chryseobacterium arachidis]SHF50252.1 Putative phage abortive infection protein [Chryseobacterium arachidis]